MMYSKIIQLIEKDKTLKETRQFNYASDKYNVEMIMGNKAHCNKVIISFINLPRRAPISIENLDEVKRYFYLGSLDRNVRD